MRHYIYIYVYHIPYMPRVNFIYILVDSHPISMARLLQKPLAVSSWALAGPMQGCAPARCTFGRRETVMAEI